MIWKVAHHMNPLVSDDLAKQDRGEIWVCQDCPRRIQVWPEYKVMERGDLNAIHFGSRNGLRITSIKFCPEQETK